MADKRKNDDPFDFEARGHHVLDGAVDQLREVLHLQLEVYARFRQGKCNFVAVEQMSQLVAMMQNQIQMVTSDELVEHLLNHRKSERAIDYEMVIQQFHLNELSSVLVEFSTPAADGTQNGAPE